MSFVLVLLQLVLLCVSLNAYSIRSQPLRSSSIGRKGKYAPFSNSQRSSQGYYECRHFASSTTTDVELSEVNTKPNTSNGLSLPSNDELLKFGLPTLAIGLLQPILSLIDTSVVGMSSTATISELAALGPGIAWIDSTAYLFYFMGIATNNLYVSARSKGNDEEAQNVVSHALVISLVIGIVLFIGQFIFAKGAITFLAGSAVETIPYALKYSQIRAFAAPFAIPTMVAQSAFLASKDSVTPFKAAIVGALVNVIGDIILVFGLAQGIGGAAAATALSQIATALYLFYAFIKTTQASVPKGTYSTGKLFKMIKVPKKEDVQRFLGFCGPLFIIITIKSILWSSTTYALSTGGVIPLAAHQISLNLFLFFLFFGDVASQISQNYLPYFLLFNKTKTPTNTNTKESTISSATPMAKESSGINTTILNDLPSTESVPPVEGEVPDMPTEGQGQGQSLDRTSVEAQTHVQSGYTYPKLKTVPNVTEMIFKVFKIAAFVGSCNMFAVGLLNHFGNGIFTKTPVVRETMMVITPLLCLCTIVHSCVCGLEGVLIALRDINFLLFSYITIGFGFVTYLESQRRAIGGLIGVWQGFAVFQWSRLLFFTLRTRYLLNNPPSKKLIGI